jgi:hypothetical protein
MTNLFRNPDALVDTVRSIMLGEKKVVETNKNDKSDDGEGLDAVQPKAVKKKFADRKDKDIDNDGDTDSSDEYLHKRRKAISKAVKEKAAKTVKEESDLVDFDFNIEEAKMPSAMIAKLKKAYEPMRDKKISIANANKLSDIMKKVGDDKDILIQLMKADIPFVSQGAVTRLITKHNMKGAQLNKMMKEEGDVEDEEVPCADCGKVHEGACATEDMKEGKTVKEEEDEDGAEKTDAQKNDMDGDGEDDTKKKKKKKDDEDEAGKPNKIDTKPEIKTAVSEDVVLDEDASNFKSAVARIKKAKSAKDLKKLEKSFERVYKQTGALTDKEFGQLDDMISDKLVKLGEEVDLDEGKVTKKERDSLEDQNEHGLLALKLTKAYGTPAEVKKIEAINKKHDKTGSIERKDQQERDKISKKYYKMAEEVESVNEKKDPDGGDENLMMSLRKAVSLRGQYDVAFKDGKKVKISQKDAQNLLNRLQKEKPADREALMKSAYKSERHFKMALKGQIEKKKNPLDLD